MLARARRAVVDASVLAAGFTRDCQRWSANSQTETLAQPGRPVFGKGDAGLGNCLWDGVTLRLVDFDYSGISDRPFDLAELMEHIEARATADASWQAFLAERQLGAAEWTRLSAARQLLAIFWAFRLSAEPADIQAAQLERAARLLSSDEKAMSSMPNMPATRQSRMPTSCVMTHSWALGVSWAVTSTSSLRMFKKSTPSEALRLAMSSIWSKLSG